LASRAAHLLYHRYPVASVCLTNIQVPVIRRAPHHLAPRRSRKWTHHCTQHNQHSQNSHVDLRHNVVESLGRPSPPTYCESPSNSIHSLPLCTRLCTPRKRCSPAGKGSAISVSYNFLLGNSWLTESFTYNFANKFRPIHGQSPFECRSEAPAFYVASVRAKSKIGSRGELFKTGGSASALKKSSSYLQYCLVPTNPPTGAGRATEIGPVRLPRAKPKGKHWVPVNKQPQASEGRLLVHRTGPMSLQPPKMSARRH
jgi:hypothetical protein